MTSQLLIWAGFGAVVLVMLALDLGVFHRKSHTVGLKEALIWSGLWPFCAWQNPVSDCATSC